MTIQYGYKPRRHVCQFLLLESSLCIFVSHVKVKMVVTWIKYSAEILPLHSKLWNIISIHFARKLWRKDKLKEKCSSQKDSNVNEMEPKSKLQLESERK